MRKAVGLVSAFLVAAGTVSMFACSVEEPPAESSEAHAEKANDVFNAPGVMSVKLSAPLSTLFQRLKDAKPDAPKPAKDGGAAPAGGSIDYSEAGKLTFTQDGVEKILDVRVYIRGESSKTDCPFPKLKLDFSDKEQLKKTPFKGHGELRINTHCGPGDEQTRSKLGRVTNGVGPVREELTYRLIRAMDIVTYRTRVFQIHYDDTASKEQLDSFAMVMESGDDMAQRLIESDPPLVPKEAELLDNAWGSSTPENETHVAIAQNFAGNKDWGGSHNVDYYGVKGDKAVFKIPQDFDLGAIVLGDNAHYWKGVATVAEAASYIKNTPGMGAHIKARQAAVESALVEAERAAMAAKAVATKDGKVTDSGFVEARARVEQLFELPEVKDAVPAGEGDHADAKDAGAADAAK